MTEPLTTTEARHALQQMGASWDLLMLLQAVIAAENRGVTLSAITDRIMTTEAGDKHLMLSR